MAHWIIGKHPGYSGVLYLCSDCDALFWDNWNGDMSIKKICPVCGADMNLEENEYVRNQFDT